MSGMVEPPKSIYDTDLDEDPWFLPPRPEDQAPTDMPWPMAARGALMNPKDWVRAENGQGRALASATAAFARLDERMRNRNADRLAVLEVASVLWAQGDRLSAEQIGLYLQLRESTVENAQQLSAADWAVRRMLGPLAPRDDLAGFLGRHKTDFDALEDMSLRAFGAAFEGLEADWWQVLDGVGTAHPFTQAAAGFHAWRVFGLSEPGDILEAATVASKIGAAEGRHLSFVPISLADRYALVQSGNVAERVAGWYHAIENACLRALMLLDQLEDWQDRALAVTHNLSGKTPPALIDALIKTPVLSVAMAAKMTDASRAAVQRNLAKFDDAGLVQEVTGQGRYRFWTARF